MPVTYTHFLLNTVWNSLVNTSESLEVTIVNCFQMLNSTCTSESLAGCQEPLLKLTIIVNLKRKTLWALRNDDRMCWGFYRCFFWSFLLRCTLHFTQSLPCLLEHFPNPGWWWHRYSTQDGVDLSTYQLQSIHHFNGLWDDESVLLTF